LGDLVGFRSTILVNDVTKTGTGKKLSVYRKEIEKK
jgi:hypothetical protein